jgi:hypothetical protein
VRQEAKGSEFSSRGSSKRKEETVKTMGIFGPGLYSGDFAMDLRTNISAVVRLPFEPEEWVQILSRSNPSASDDQTNEEHTTFWLVVADQFAKAHLQ